MSTQGPDGDLADLLTHALRDLSPGPIGIAVSGGGDSMALLDLAHRVLAPKGFTILAATVDHALRPQSRAEARMVADFCASRGLSHHILTWSDGPKAAADAGNLMDKARQARMRLLGAWALRHGVPSVLLGHTRDDQAEGFVMNLSRAAGIDGLSGMRAGFVAQGIVFLRPLLTARRARLRDHLVAHGIGWIDDPTNENDRFARSKARKALTAMAGLGVDADQIAASIAHLQDARTALLMAAAEAARAHSRVQAAALVLSPKTLALPAETLRRLIVLTILWMTGGDYPPRGRQMDRLILALQSGRPAQLAGLRFLTRKGEIWIAPEMRSQAPTAASCGIPWRLDAPPTGAEWRMLGENGLRQRPLWRKSGLPRLALEPTPALWRGDQLIAAPALDQGEGPEFHAEIAQSLADFISLH